MVDIENTSVVANGRIVAVSQSSTEESERNPIFDALVSSEGEVSGLVAYSIYKQNKRAWLDDFIKLSGRTPTDAETRAYIIGESTDRRLATYRQLASLTLSGPAARPTLGSVGGGVGGYGAVVWAAVALVALALLGYVLHAANIVAK